MLTCRTHVEDVDLVHTNRQVPVQPLHDVPVVVLDREAQRHAAMLAVQHSNQCGLSLVVYRHLQSGCPSMHALHTRSGAESGKF